MAVDCPYCGALFRSRADVREHIDRNHVPQERPEPRKWVTEKKEGLWEHRK